MSEPFLGEIRIFAGNFAPKDWALCNGQIMPISQNTALFSLLGVNFGGNGTTTFGLPDLRDRMPMHWGQGPGLSDRVIGETGGAPTVVLTLAELGTHTHAPNAEPAGTDNAPTAAIWASSSNRNNTFVTTTTPNTTMAANLIDPAGAAQPAAHPNVQPFLATTYIIALAGIFPQRP